MHRRCACYAYYDHEFEDSCPCLCHEGEDDFDADELGLDPEESYD